MYKVYGDIQSGNCYKIKLLMNLLKISHDWIHVDILKSESRTESIQCNECEYESSRAGT